MLAVGWRSQFPKELLEHPHDLVSGFPQIGISLVAQMVKNLCGLNPWARKIPWRREWQPTQIFLPGEFHGQRSLVGHSLWSPKESDMTEQLTLEIG